MKIPTMKSFELDKNLAPKDDAVPWWWSADYMGKTIVAVGLLIVAVFGVLLKTGYIEFDAEVWVPDELSELLWVLYIYGSVNSIAFVWQLYLVLTYRPFPLSPRRDLPMVTVVVPAYNEGRQVMETLESVVRSDYPRKKLQVIAVDDGSKDDTWQWMEAAAAKLKGRVELVRLPANKGKRRALYEGFHRAKGKVFVTIDSDSLVERQTIRHLVAPFSHDARCGAVAGNVRVLNRKAGLIPRMLEVTFNYGFDFMRASQSRFNTVFCTPGALSAYRSDLVMKVLDDWLDQRFMGEPAGIGEDRAMTNMILKLGYHVVFQRHAVVFTNVPTTFKGLCKMYLRWARSNVRETIAMAKFAFRRFRPTSALCARLELLRSIMNMSLGEVGKVIAFVILIGNLELLAPGFIVACTISAIMPAAFFLLRHRDSDFLWAFTYAPYSAVALSWISLYAIFTMKRSAWLTRELPAQVTTLAPIQLQAPVMSQANADKAG